MKSCVLTAIYGSYDSLKPVCPQDIDVEWICVTDNSELEQEGWNIVVEPRSHLHPARAGKLPKILPWLYTDCETSIWIDASFRVISSTFASEALSHANPIAQFDHPWRNCIYKEIEELKRITKFKDEIPKLIRQEEFLRQRNYPVNKGLWATGVIARYHTPEIIGMGFDWLKHVYQFSYRDQSSQGFVCWENNVIINKLPGSYLDGKWLSYEASSRH